MPKETGLLRISVLMTVLGLVQLGLLGFQARQIHELGEDVEDLQKAVASRGRVPAKADPLSALGRQIEDQTRATQEVQRALEEMGERTANLEKSAEGVRARLNDGAGMPAGDGTSPEALQELVASAVKKGLEEHKSWGDEKKPTLSELKDALALNGQQEVTLKGVLDAGKQQAYDVTVIARADGTNKLDDFVKAMKSADPQGESIKAFTSLATEKVPGRTTTYLEEIMKVQESVKIELRRQMSGDQYTKFEQMQVDVLEVKTGFDPFEKYVLENIGK